MRVSTAQFYSQNAQQLTRLQSDVNETNIYISANKRVLTAKDDAVAYGTLTGIKDELANIKQYGRNLNQAEGRNSLQHGSFGDAEEAMLELEKHFIQANGGALTDDDFAAIGLLVKKVQKQLLDIANVKDETGGYIFSGYQVGVKPFVIQPDNSVNYMGDSGIRELQIGKNVMIDNNQAGDKAFMQVKNALGDFSAKYNFNSSGISVNQAIIKDPSSYDTINNPPNYNFKFTSATTLNVTDGAGNNVFSTTTYVPGQVIAFNGVEVQLDGNPLPGDDFHLTPQDNISIFDTIKGIVDWVAVGESPVNSVQHGVDYAELLGQLKHATQHMTTRQVDAGVRLKLIDNQRSSHSGAEINLAKGQSNIEDLDFAKATADLERSKVTLQAAMLSYVKVKDLSLFNYL